MLPGGPGPSVLLVNTLSLELLIQVHVLTLHLAVGRKGSPGLWTCVTFVYAASLTAHLKGVLAVMVLAGNKLAWKFQEIFMRGLFSEV